MDKFKYGLIIVFIGFQINVISQNKKEIDLGNQEKIISFLFRAYELSDEKDSCLYYKIESLSLDYFKYDTTSYVVNKSLGVFYTNSAVRIYNIKPIGHKKNSKELQKKGKFYLSRMLRHADD